MRIEPWIRPTTMLAASLVIIAAACSTASETSPVPSSDAPPSTEAAIAAPVTPSPTGRSDGPSAGAEGTPPAVTDTDPAMATTSPSRSTEEPSDNLDPPHEACGLDRSGIAWEDGPSATAVAIADSPLSVAAVVYPRPDYAGRPWSQWGQGVVTKDGRFLSAIGDHLGVDGNSYFYEFDPASGLLTQIADAHTLAGHSAGAWGYGKVHAQMVEGPCDDVYVTTYWGTRRDLAFGSGYEGDLLVRLDPTSDSISNLGVFHDRHGVPSLASAPELGLVFAEAVDPLAPPGGSGSFVVIDVTTGETVFADHDSDHSGFRSIAVTSSGEALYSLGDGRLARFDPTTRGVEPFPESVPGDIIRAVTPPTETGSILGVTDGPAVFFEITADGTIRTIGPASGYITSIVASPDGSTIYSVPDAHGGAWRNGTPLIATDVVSGESQTLMELNDVAVDELGLRLGGTYSLALTPDGSTLYIGMNAAVPEGDREAFGEIVLLVVDLP